MPGAHVDVFSGGEVRSGHPIQRRLVARFRAGYGTYDPALRYPAVPVRWSFHEPKDLPARDTLAPARGGGGILPVWLAGLEPERPAAESTDEPTRCHG